MDSDCMFSLVSLFQYLTTHSEINFFPSIQPEPSLVQLKATMSYPIVSYLGKEAKAYLSREGTYVAQQRDQMEKRHIRVVGRHVQTLTRPP